MGQPKHDAPIGRGFIRLCTVETEQGPRLFVWNQKGQSLGVMSWQKAFTARYLVG